MLKDFNLLEGLGTLAGSKVFKTWIFLRVSHCLERSI